MSDYDRGYTGERVREFCPLHEVRGECWAGCGPERYEFRRAARALSTYWFDRKRGMGVAR